MILESYGQDRAIKIQTKYNLWQERRPNDSPKQQQTTPKTHDRFQNLMLPGTWSCSSAPPQWYSLVTSSPRLRIFYKQGIRYSLVTSSHFIPGTECFLQTRLAQIRAHPTGIYKHIDSYCSTFPSLKTVYKMTRHTPCQNYNSGGFAFMKPKKCENQHFEVTTSTHSKISLISFVCGTKWGWDI